MYRVRDISTFLIKNRLREWGITLAVIALLWLLTYPFMTVIIAYTFSKGGEIFLGFFLMLYFGITTIVDDGNLALQRGVTRNTLAKSYTLASNTFIYSNIIQNFVYFLIYSTMILAVTNLMALTLHKFSIKFVIVIFVSVVGIMGIFLYTLDAPDISNIFKFLVF